MPMGKSVEHFLDEKCWRVQLTVTGATNSQLVMYKKAV